MRRLSLVAALVVVLSSTLAADIRSDQRVKFQFGGALGKLVNMFSKGARDGVITTVAVKGNRKASMTGDTGGQIIDLSEEKIYDLDLKKKTYKVTTFAELRRQMEEARREAEKNARESAEPAKPAEKDPNQKEYEIDFDIKNTAETKTINGFDTKKSVITITVREKGKTLNDAGGMVMTTEMWMTSGAPSTRDLAEFDRKYAEKIYGPMVSGASAQDMAAAMAMYPQIKPAIEKMAAEGNKIQGTPILTDMKVEAVPPGTADQAAAAPAAAEPEQKKGRFGGLVGGLKKMTEAGKGGGSEKPQRAVVMTTSVEMLKLTTDVDAASVAIPAGFTERK